MFKQRSKADVLYYDAGDTASAKYDIYAQKTFSGSAFNFIKRFLFRVKQTRQEL